MRRMFDVSEWIARVEAQVKVDGSSVAAVLRAAGVNRSTWSRWKAGAPPSVRLMERVDRVAFPHGRRRPTEHTEHLIP